MYQGERRRSYRTGIRRHAPRLSRATIRRRNGGSGKDREMRKPDKYVPAPPEADRLYFKKHEDGRVEFEAVGKLAIVAGVVLVLLLVASAVWASAAWRSSSSTTPGGTVEVGRDRDAFRSQGPGLP